MWNCCAGGEWRDHWRAACRGRKRGMRGTECQRWEEGGPEDVRVHHASFVAHSGTISGHDLTWFRVHLNALVT